MRGGGWIGVGGVGGRAGQGGLERRIEAFVKIQKKYLFFGVGGATGGVTGGGVGALGLGVRVDVNGEVKRL